MDAEEPATGPAWFPPNGGRRAGGLLAVAALIAIVPTAVLLPGARGANGAELFMLGWAVASAFISGMIIWRWTAGARSLFERRGFLVLGAVGMTFVINAGPYIVFWGVGFLVALIGGAGLFGWPAAPAAGAWAWAITSVLRPAEEEAVVWTSRPRGLSFWAGLGIIAIIWSVVAWVTRTIPVL